MAEWPVNRQLTVWVYLRIVFALEIIQFKIARLVDVAIWSVLSMYIDRNVSFANCIYLNRCTYALPILSLARFNDLANFTWFNFSQRRSSKSEKKNSWKVTFCTVDKQIWTRNWTRKKSNFFRCSFGFATHFFLYQQTWSSDTS